MFWPTHVMEPWAAHLGTDRATSLFLPPYSPDFNPIELGCVATVADGGW